MHCEGPHLRVREFERGYGPQSHSSEEEGEAEEIERNVLQ